MTAQGGTYCSEQLMSLPLEGRPFAFCPRQHSDVLASGESVSRKMPSPTERYNNFSPLSLPFPLGEHLRSIDCFPKAQELSGGRELK